MRNSVPLLCLWSVHCCFAAGSPTPPGPEGRLQGNVHLPLLPTPHPSFSGPCPLSVSPTLFQPFPVPAKSFPFPLPIRSSSVHLFLGAPGVHIPSKASEKPQASVCAGPRSPSRPTPFLDKIPWIGAVQPAESAAGCSLTVPFARREGC